MMWVTRIADAVSAIFKGIRKPAQAIPPILLLCEINQRPGLSAMALASAIIARLPEIGIDTAALPNGEDSQIKGFVRILSEEIVKEIKENSVVDCATEPQSIAITGSGSNAGGPVPITGFNSDISNIKGIVR